MMKNRSILLIVLLVVVAFVAGFSVAAPQKWEYQETCGNLKNLNELGGSGWELVGATNQTLDIKCFYLKRQR